jgi:hypothetical protein
MVTAVAAKLDSVTFDELVAQQNPFNNPARTWDLRAYQFISPAGLVQLAAACHAMGCHPKRCSISIDQTALRTYLLRAGFVASVRDVADFVPPFPSRGIYERLRGSNPLLIEVTKIQNGAELPPLLDQIVDVLRHRLRYRKHDAFDVATAVSEICQNTFDHNSDTCGFLAMQVFGRGQKRFLEIGVADYGEGLAATLRRNRKNGRVVSDLQGIHLGTQLHTSEHDDPTRGTGLYHLLEIAYEHEGSVQIRSGAGKVRYRMDQRQGWKFSVSPVPGVQIALALRAKGKA